MGIYIPQGQQTENRMNPKKATMRYNQTVKRQIQRENLESNKEKKDTLCTREIPIRLLVNSSAKTLQVRREWDNKFEMLKKKKIY